MRRWRFSNNRAEGIPPLHMSTEHSLKPLWIGLGCMAIGVLLIYWAFHSGSKVVDEVPTDDDDGVICAQVITSAKNPETGEVVDYPTPCDVPEGFEVVQAAVVP